MVFFNTTIPTWNGTGLVCLGGVRVCVWVQVLLLLLMPFCDDESLFPYVATAP
jgi:uncharacterized protein YhhL (DUF1145 family)